MGESGELGRTFHRKGPAVAPVANEPLSEGFEVHGTAACVVFARINPKQKSSHEDTTTTIGRSVTGELGGHRKVDGDPSA